MDNFAFNMICTGKTTLADAIALAFAGAGHKAAVGYVIRAGHKAFTHEAYRHLDKPKRPDRIIFLWSDYEKKEGYVAFPFKMDAFGCADFAARWLDECAYGREPDHDGDNEKGWRVYNESWGHVEDLHSAIIAVAPAWACYGK